MDIKDLPPKYQKQAEEKLGRLSNTDSPTKPKKAHKTNKYNAVKESVGNITFDSKKERERFEELMLMVKSGEIRNLKLQHEFTLQGGFTTTDGERIRAIKYIADFTYWRGNVFVIEDTKGYRTDIYKQKKKMMMDKGWRITEI